MMSFTDPTNHPYESPSRPSPQAPDVTRVCFAVLWVGFVLIAGGALVSYSALEFGELGLLVVWPIGWAGGFVASKILGGRSKPVGGLLVATCFAMTVFAEVNWIHAKIEGADESWFKTISLLPAFVRQYTYSALMALIFAIFGAMAAWQAVAVRYVRVRIDD